MMRKIFGCISLVLLSCLLFPSLSFGQSRPYFVIKESYVQGLLSPDNRPSFPRNIINLDREVGLEAGQKVYFWLFFSIPVPNPNLCTDKDAVPCVFTVTITGKDKSGAESVQELTKVESLNLSAKSKGVWFMFSETLNENYIGKASMTISFTRNQISLYELEIPVDIHLYK